MSKFELVELLKEFGFSDGELLDMFIYWEDITEVETCVNDFLNDRDLIIVNNNIEEK